MQRTKNSFMGWPFVRVEEYDFRREDGRELIIAPTARRDLLAIWDHMLQTTLRQRIE